jgi:hypothetical protein
MRGAGWGRRYPRAAAVATAGLALMFAACGAPATDPIAVPTFPSRAGEAVPATGADGRAISADCGRIFSTGDLEALFGLPLGSVGVRTTIGVPQPSVGRTERVACDYTLSGSRGRPLLDVNVTAYVDEAAAALQWRVNVDAEAGERRDVPLGAASAVLIERPGEAVLMVAHGATNLTLVLPDQPLPGGRNRGDVLVDLALRILPAVSVESVGNATPTRRAPAGANSASGTGGS